MLILAVIVCLLHVEFSHALPVLPSKTTGRGSRRTVSGGFFGCFPSTGPFCDRDDDDDDAVIFS